MSACARDGCEFYAESTGEKTARESYNFYICLRFNMLWFTWNPRIRILLDRNIKKKKKKSIKFLKFK